MTMVTTAGSTLWLSIVAAGIFLATGASAIGPVPECGNVNRDADVNLSDAVYLLNALFIGGPAVECASADDSCADVNGDDEVNLSDAAYLLNHLFLGGPEPRCGGGGGEEIEGFTAIGENAQGYPEYAHDDTGMVFVLLPGGAFNMGSAAGEAGREAHEGPVHEVTLSPFLIGKYEVTQAQWEAVMGDNPSAFGPDGHMAGDIPADVDRGNLPVDQVSWDAAQDFEELTGLTLPSEAQWEYACRAGTRTAYSFGSGASCPDSNCAPCPERDTSMWYCGNSGERPHEVGTREPNAFGLHDVHGNAWEWCEDVYRSDFYSSAGASGPDPVCTSGPNNILRVYRGGGWNGRAWYTRSARRIRSMSSLRHVFLGVRFTKSLAP